MPYLLGQIGLVGNFGGCRIVDLINRTLPIRSNRISWKPPIIKVASTTNINPYLLGQIGLVGNFFSPPLRILPNKGNLTY